MSVADLAHHQPRVRFKVLDGFLGITAEMLEQRLVSFEFEDHDRKADKTMMKFENADGVLLEPARIAMGVALQVTFGYPGAEQERVCVIRRIKGLVQRPRGNAAGRQGDLGLATFEGYGRLMSLNFMAAPALGPFRGVTISQAVDSIIRKYLPRESIDIEDTKTQLTEITVRADETEGHFIARMARRTKFVVGFSDQEFFFRKSGAEQTAPEALDYRLSPDVISWEIDLDLVIPRPDLIEAKTWDVRRRAFVFHTAKTVTGAEAQALQAALAAAPGTAETTVPGGFLGLESHRRLNNVSRMVVHVPAVEKQNEEAVRKLEGQIERGIKLTLRLVGNPRLRAGSKVALSNFGTFIDGVWHIKQCTHQFDGGGVYVTILKLVGDSPAPASDGAAVNVLYIYKDADAGDAAPRAGQESRGGVLVISTHQPRR